MKKELQPYEATSNAVVEEKKKNRSAQSVSGQRHDSSESMARDLKA
jgi:hypothetical protein